MLACRGYKYRIYPAKAQVQKIESFLGASRFVYNHFLKLKQDLYASFKKSMGQAEVMRLVTQLKAKHDFVWLAASDSMALQESIKDLFKAFDNFFSKRGKFPRFKRKHAAKQSYRTRNQKNCIRITGSYITLPKLGKVKARISRIPSGRILNATVTKSSSGKYFVSLCVEEEILFPVTDNRQIGIDVGLKDFASLSTGESIPREKFLSCYEKRLVKEQRRLSHKKKGSQNYQKQSIRLAKVHEKISNTRNDFLHKQSSLLARENQVVCAEDLNIKGMLHNHHLAKAISDASWSRFLTLLDYKLSARSGVLIKVPTFYPSSQTCSCCGFQNPIVKDLSIRQWVCPQCSTHHNRDINAARNILSKGLSMP